MGHRYPRRWKHKVTFVDCDFAQCDAPGTKLRYGRLDGTFDSKEWRYEDEAEEYVANGVWIETFDHHGDAIELDRIEKRCAIAYLKGLVKELREENKSLRQEIETMQIMARRRESPEQPRADVFDDCP